MVKVLGNATTGYAGTGPEHIALPQPVLTRVSHRPWCADCKRKHEATDLDEAGRCAKCARAVISRAEAEARRAERADEIAALEKAAQADVAAAARKANSVVRRTTKLPAERKQGKPTSRTSAPATASTSSTTGRAPEAGRSTTQRTEPPASTAAAQRTEPAGGDRNLDAQVDHATRLLRDTATSTSVTVQAARRTAINALELLHLVHGLQPASPAAPDAPSPVSGPAPQTTVGPREGEAPARRSTGFETFQRDPRRIILPTQEVIAAYQAGKSLGQIADQHGVSAPTIRRCLIDNDISRRRTPVEHTPELIELVRRLYDDEHLTQAEIAIELGRSTKVVQNLMTAAGVDRRAAQARQAADNSRALKTRMADLGVTSADVRRWATATGRPMKSRGLPSRADVEAYAAAHQPPSTTQPTGDTAA